MIGTSQLFGSFSDLISVEVSLIFVLQGGEAKYRKAWAQICEISRNEFNRVYERLGVELEEKVRFGFPLYIILNTCFSFQIQHFTRFCLFFLVSILYLFVLGLGNSSFQTSDPS